MADLTGKRIGQYQITSLLGKGGMAAVYRARQERINREVAIKIIKTELAESPEFVKRFHREAETIAAMNHANILKLFDFGQHEDMLYLVTELQPGGSLADLIRQGPLPLETTSKLLDQIASALDYAHRQGIIHRDLKPQNVLLDSDGNAILTDFGIAKVMDETTALTQSGMAMGTPAYMSPEQWQGIPIDSRADIYALGILLFEMLSGRLPFQGDTPFSMMHMHVNDTPPSVISFRPELPRQVDLVIKKALTKNRDARFSTAGELARAFRTALMGQTPPGIALPVTPLGDETSAVPTLLGGAVNDEKRRGGRAGLLVIAVVLLAIVIGGGLFVASSVSQPSATAIPTTIPTTVAPTAVPTTAEPTRTPTDVPTATPMPTLTPDATETVIAEIRARLTAIAGSPTRTPPPTNTPTPDATETVIAEIRARLTAIAGSPTRTPTIAVAANTVIGLRARMNRTVAMRSEPESAAPIVDWLPADTIGVILEDAGNRTWFKVSFESGKEGWVPSDAVDLFEPVSPSSGRAVINRTVALRTQPAPDAPIADWLSSGMTVHLIEALRRSDYGQTWYRVRVEASGREGWLPSDALNILTEAAATPHPGVSLPMTVVMGAGVVSTFRDDFEGETLSSSHWIHENVREHIGVANGHLTYRGQNNWDAYLARGDSSGESYIEVNEGFLTAFQFQQGEMILMLSYGNWEAPDYRRWFFETSDVEWRYGAQFGAEGATYQQYGSVRLRAGIWYYLLLYVEGDGDLHIQLWERDHPSNFVVNDVKPAPRSTWAGQPWGVFIAVNTGRLALDSYEELRFPENYPIPMTPPPASSLLSLGVRARYTGTEVGHLRSGAGLSFDVVTDIDPGQEFTIVSFNPNKSWARVRLDDGNVGWLSTFVIQSIAR